MADEELLAGLLSRLRDLPTLPAVVRRVREILADPRSSAAEVAEAIRADQALSARILRIVNSAFYGLTHQIASIRHAVAMLGYRAIHNIVLSVSVYDNLMAGKSPGHLDAPRFWRHAVACGACALHLARHSGAGEPEEAYTAGLLHDLGKVVLDRLMGEGYGKVVRAVREGGQIVEQERLLLGTSHDEVGGLVAERWNFPAPLRDAIRLHHESDLRRVGDPATRRLAALLAVCDWLVWEMGFPSMEAAQRPALSPQALAEVDLSRVDRARLTAEIEGELRRAQELFHLGPLPDSVEGWFAPRSPADSGLFEQVRAELEQRAVETSLLGSVMASVRRHNTVDEILRALLHEAREGFRFDRVLLFRPELGGGGIRLAEIVDRAGHHQPRRLPPLPIGPEAGPIQACAADRKPFLFRGRVELPGVARGSDHPRELGGAAIVVEDRLLAVIAASNEDSKTPITDLAVAGLDQLAREVALVIENKKLAAQFRDSSRLARTDDLTGLANRRHCLALLDEALAAANASGGPLAVVMMDLDHFKYYNDEHGHAAGDRVLIGVAAILRGNSRAEDTCGRLGGDEFLAILPGASAEQGERFAGRARELVEALGRQLLADYPGGKLSLSAGVAVAEPNTDDGAALLARADERLYAAKAAGRGQVR